jgi:hypothetical protein
MTINQAGIHILDAMRGPLDGLFKIRIFEDDGGTLSSQFESDVLQVSLCGCFHDFASRCSASGK